VTQYKNDVSAQFDFLLSQEVMRLAAHFTFRRSAPPSLEKGRLDVWFVFVSHSGDDRSPLTVYRVSQRGERLDRA
jgi:hypothetical protein